MIARWVAPESLVLELVAENPNVDVRRAAREFSDWSATHDCSAPEKMLRHRVAWDRYAIEPGAKPATTPAPTPFGERSDPSYAAFRFALLQRVLDGLTPNQTADVLAEHHAKFAELPHRGIPGGLGELIDREIELYRRMGDCWQRVDWETWELLNSDPQTDPAGVGQGERP